MGLKGAFICIFRGHLVSNECQIALKNSAGHKYVTKCERCRYPLRLEIIDKDRFYAIELDSAKEVYPNRFK